MQSQQSNDEKAIILLEKAAMKAKKSIETTLAFRPFMMMIDSQGLLKTVENRALTDYDSYSLLEDSLTSRVKSQDDIEIVILAIKDMMPSKLSNGESKPTIRLHLEERSQLDKKVSARFLYIPYTIYSTEEQDRYQVELGVPAPVGFPAEYLSMKQINN